MTKEDYSSIGVNCLEGYYIIISSGGSYEAAWIRGLQPMSSTCKHNKNNAEQGIEKTEWLCSIIDGHI